MVKNLPSNGEDVGLIPGWGTKIPHTSGQPSWRAATAETRHSRASALQQEKPLYHNRGLEQPKKRRNFAETQENWGFFSTNYPGFLAWCPAINTALAFITVEWLYCAWGQDEILQALSCFCRKIKFVIPRHLFGIGLFQAENKQGP